MVIDHSNCEKGYKVYNISDNDHNKWRKYIIYQTMIITNGEPI